MTGQLYDPFYYFPGFSYAQHPEIADTLMQCWLASTHTRLWAVDPNNAYYLKVIADHPEWFTKVGSVDAYAWMLEDVRVPAVSAAECASANKAAAAT